MIVDTHVWLSEPDSWGDLTMMDDTMIDAGWTEIGEKTGLNQGMSGEQMVARMDEAGVNVRFLKYAKHFKVLDKCLWGTDHYDCREDVPYIKSFPRLSREFNIAPGLPDLTDDDIAAYLGGNAAIVPQLLNAGITQGQIDDMLIENPKRIFAV